MLTLARMLSAQATLPTAAFVPGDATAALPGGPFDVVLCSYMLNELAPAARAQLVSALYARAGSLLLLVEPGTPEGFAGLQQATAHLPRAARIAPCPPGEACPLPADDWCHSVCRINRIRAHKMLKEAQSPFEDEKFCYVAYSPLYARATPAPMRVLRHPQIRKGLVALQLCTGDALQRETVTKKQRAVYAAARDLIQGDAWAGGASSPCKEGEAVL